MWNWNRLSIRQKLLYATLPATMVATLALVIIAIWKLDASGDMDLKRNGRTIAVLMGESLKPAVQFEDTGVLDLQLHQLVEAYGDIALAAVVVLESPSKSPRVISQVKRPGSMSLEGAAASQGLASAAPKGKQVVELPAEGHIVLATPVPEAGKEAFVVLVIDRSRITSQTRRSAVLMVAAGLLILSLSYPLAKVVARNLVRPLELIQKHMGEIARGDGDLRASLEVVGNDEIARLAEDFNQFVGSIRVIVQEVMQVSLSLASGSHEMQGGMGEMAATANAIAESGESQKGSVLRATEAIGTISQSSRAISRTVTNTPSVFEEARHSASRGGEAVEGAVKGMGAIQDNSRKIENILHLITEIANQTNLLSLNAAIEAAKAGEHGKGFAVVAEEVRKLAERSAMAVKEIDALLRTSVVSIEDGTHRVHSIGELLKGIQTAIQASSEQMMTIGGQNTALSRDSTTVSEVIEKLLSIAESNAAIDADCIVASNGY